MATTPWPPASAGVNLPLDRMDVLDGGEIEIFAKDERLQALQKRLARGDVARAGPRLDHRRAFPVLAHALVVKLGRFGRERDLRRARVGAQAQIDAKAVAVARRFLYRAHEALYEADAVFRWVLVLRERKNVAIEKDDDVDVAGIVQLARAVLAHREHDEAAVPAGLARIARIEAARRGVLQEEEAQRLAHAGVGKRRDGARHLLPAPGARDVGERDGQRRVPLGRADGGHQFVHRRR